ncbi:hypothetical protein SMSP2_00414 [Limihaloglobus sulfuriphilus]|uniref:Glycosyl hydrolases family 2, sugar binding domain n=1 Tax=Limihaloglobus sulfuriphilus TaxID=1851148 RepID=A0A1Q2MBH0_9BACT|nr:glycosyl hydrolase [Limihaloglobus sulfuriphilus]AQQ70075.1 hypothetical protein SMSP2_00414 [Limihaloglobus sulfuriphilus]
MKTINDFKNISKVSIFLFAAFAFVSLSCASGLVADFQDPPRDTGVRCWWWWLNSNVTKESITQDLEAMHEKGFSGAMIFDAGTELRWGPDNPVPNGPMFSGPEWTELFLHALHEAERLSLELGLSIQSGWNLGGPGVTLENAAKQLTFSEISISGRRNFEGELPLPQCNYGFYRDICVLAYPKPDNKERRPIKDLSAKTGSKELGGSAPDCRFLLNDVPAEKGEQDTLLEDILVISGKLGTEGILRWQVPKGEWIILRIGYTPTKAHVATSSDNWKGHVLDYLSEDAFNNYWDQVVDPLLKKAGPLAGTVLKQLETDSWECGGMNWSENFGREFKHRCGYDITPYLAVAAGKIVESREVSNAFLADLRKTIAACVSDNHYRVFAQRAAEHNLGIQPESAGPHAAPVDGITNYSHSDIVMSEFWIECPHRPGPQNRFFVKQASSAAHIYGKKLVAAESFTSLRKPHWQDVLWQELKPAMDHEFCSGLNMIFLHTFTASPKEMGIPGQEYFAGTHFNPNVTWWDYSDEFFDYIARLQYIFQKGKFNADVLYYYGDHVPNIARLKESDPAGALAGYDYDVTNEDVLLRLEVSQGRVVVPGGIHYRVLVLPDHRVLSLAAIEKVEFLLSKGASVIGAKPERLVSLKGGRQAQIKFHKIADKLWGQNPQMAGVKSVNSGILAWGMSTREFLNSRSVLPDFETSENPQEGSFDYIHYTVEGCDVYFVSNQTENSRKADCTFRISGRQPAIWNPVTGNIKTASAFSQSGGRTTVPLQFAPYGSCLVVFGDAIPQDKQGTGKSNYPDLHLLDEIDGPWLVSFDPEWGGPARVRFETLCDWSEHPAEGIRYYSGEAEYDNNFDLPLKEFEKRYWLQLNDLRDVGIASVKLNGKDLGTLWTKPFRIEITDTLKAGQNDLNITVVNSWMNRLIGDRGKPQNRRFTKTNIKIRDDWKLQKAGLLGPVQIMID